VSGFSEDNENTPNLYKSSGEKITFYLDRKEAIATSTVLDFDELGAVLSEKLIGFWSSFYGSWFMTEGQA
jgi:hypothetical protein